MACFDQAHCVSQRSACRVMENPSLPGLEAHCCLLAHCWSPFAKVAAPRKAGFVAETEAMVLPIFAKNTCQVPVLHC